MRSLALAVLATLLAGYLYLVWHHRWAIWECAGQGSYCVWTKKAPPG